MHIIRYKPSFSDEAIEELRAFSNRSDRDDPLQFVGRNDLFENVESKIQRVNQTGTSRSNGLFLKGAPGSGKSAFLRELVRRYGDSDTVCAVWTGVDQLTHPVSFLTSLMERDVLEAKEGGRSVQIGGVSWLPASVTWSSRKTSIIEDVNNGVPVWSIIRSLCDNSATDTVFLLCFDEAQRIEPDEGHDFNRIAVNIHDGNTGQVKVVPVFAGLSDMPNKLKNVKVSRSPDGFTPMPVLSEQERIEAVRKFFTYEKFDMTGQFQTDGKDRIVRSIASASEGWPRHLHCYLKSLAAAIVEDLHRPQPLGQLDLGRVLEAGHEHRIDYAVERLDAANLYEFEEVLMNAAEHSSEPELGYKRLKEGAADLGMETSEFKENLETAISCGILEQSGSKNGDNQYRFPIPSFHTFMANRKEIDLTLKHMEEARY